MKLLTIALSLAAALGASALARASLAAPPDAAPREDLARSLERAEATVARLERELDAAETRILERRRAAPDVAASERVAVGQLDAAVARWLAEHEAEAPGSAAAQTVAAPAPELQAFSLQDLLESYANASGGEDIQLLWGRLRETGRDVELLAALEARAAELPGDAELQLALGTTYLFQIFGRAAGPEAGEWAMKADKSFDRALELDPDLWDARFLKAVALSNWPPFMGKTNEAVEHFEILRERAATMPSDPRFAEVYLYLGNVYLQSGQREKALAAWREGLERFPGHAELARQLATNG